MDCKKCEKPFKTARGLARHICPFLDYPEPIQSKHVGYDDQLKKKSLRFPSYKRYLGRGDDYYNIGGITTWRKRQQVKEKS